MPIRAADQHEMRDFTAIAIGTPPPSPPVPARRPVRDARPDWTRRFCHVATGAGVLMLGGAAVTLAVKAGSFLGQINGVANTAGNDFHQVVDVTKDAIRNVTSKFDSLFIGSPG